MPVAPQQLLDVEGYLGWLDGHPTAFPPGERFAYCNDGYAVLALIAQRASGMVFQDLVTERVLGPAGMTRSGFFRSDDLPADTAIGYVEVDGVERSNVFHLPIRGGGDGGLFTTVGDLARFWSAFWAGRIVARASVAAMIAPTSDVPEEGARYARGFWLAASGSVVKLVGGDAGVSFQTSSDPDSGRVATVLCNTTDGAWPVMKELAAALSAESD